MMIDVRPAHPDDAADLIRIHFNAVHSIEVDSYSRELLGSWSPEPCLARTEWMRGVLLSKDRLVLAARIDRQLGGFAICAPSDGFVQGAGACTLFASRNAVGFYSASGYIVQAPATLRLADGAVLACTRMRKPLASNRAVPG